MTEEPALRLSRQLALSGRRASASRQPRRSACSVPAVAPPHPRPCRRPDVPALLPSCPDLFRASISALRRRRLSAICHEMSCSLCPRSISCCSFRHVAAVPGWPRLMCCMSILRSISFPSPRHRLARVAGPCFARIACARGRAFRGGAARAPDCACAREPNAGRTSPLGFDGVFSRRRRRDGQRPPDAASSRSIWARPVRTSSFFVKYFRFMRTSCMLHDGKALSLGHQAADIPLQARPPSFSRV